jgi:ATP-dependent RNA helicase RhlE
MISSLADDLLDNPIKVAVKPVATTAERVEQGVMFVGTPHKPALLRKVLENPAMEKVLVFSRTKHGADKVVRQLSAGGVEAAAIHGNKSQPQRERALAQFKDGDIRVLVATDIAARGIHVDEVSHVVNYDLPNVAESYVHRIGRTARAGAAGIALSFCNGEERAYLRDIEKLTRMNVPVLPLPEGLAALAESMPAVEAPRDRRGNGQRPNSRPAGHRNGQPNGKGAQGGRARGETRSGQPLDDKTGLPAFVHRAWEGGGRRSR